MLRFIGHDLGQRVRIIQKRNRWADLKILSWKVSFCGFMESQERILQLDHFCSHWSIKLPMKFFAPIMRYRTLLLSFPEVLRLPISETPEKSSTSSIRLKRLRRRHKKAKPMMAKLTAIKNPVPIRRSERKRRRKKIKSWKRRGRVKIAMISTRSRKFG